MRTTDGARERSIRKTEDRRRVNRTMRVMTFNLRFENDRDGKNAWCHRRDLVCRVIDRHAPDILGTQEGRWNQLLYLEDNLPAYQMHAPRRVIDDTCQYPTLFFRKERIRIEEGAEFWLSKTPNVHRSKNWDSAFPRMVSFARVCALDHDRVLWAAVSHLDHIGVRARQEQARLLADWVRSRQEPVVLMGDFNDRPGSPVHQLLTGPATGLVDTWLAVRDEDGEASYTHHDFSGVPMKARMDWILVSRHFRVVDVRIIRDHREGLYPSDHFPYLAELQWR